MVNKDELICKKIKQILRPYNKLGENCKHHNKCCSEINHKICG